MWARRLRRDLVEAREQRVHGAPVVRRDEQVDVGVRARRREPEQLLGPAAEHPGRNTVTGEEFDHPLDEPEVVHAAETAAASSRGKRRETTWETPSPPIVTP